MTERDARQKPDMNSAAPKVEEVAVQIPSVLKIFNELENKGHRTFSHFFSEIYPFIRMPKTTQQVLAAFSSRDVTAEKVSGFIKSNPALAQVLFQVVESYGKKIENPSLESVIVLLGMQNSRNLVVATQLLRSMGTELAWTPEGKLKTLPSEYLKYALKTEEAVSTSNGIKADYGDLAFSAGIFFDIFTLLASKAEYSGRKKKLLSFIDDTYNQSLKTARIAVEVVRIVPEFAYQRLFFVAALMHDIGKIALAFSEPGYLEFSERAAKKGLTRQIRRFAEAKEFGVNHSVFGSVICYSYYPFAAFARTVLYQHEPFLLSTRRKNIYKLTAVVSLCTNIAAQFKKPESVDDPIISVWKGIELKDLKLHHGELIKALSKVPS